MDQILSWLKGKIQEKPQTDGYLSKNELECLIEAVNDILVGNEKLKQVMYQIIEENKVGNSKNQNV